MRTMALVHALLLSALLLPAGCAEREWARYSPFRQGVQQRSTATQPARPRQPKSTEEASLPGPLSSPPAAEEGGSAPQRLERLVGLDADQVQRLLGPPSEYADRPPAKVWVYRTERCKLDLSLYLDVKSKVFRTLAYEVTSHDGSDKGKRLCVAELEARRSGQ
jgi:hypothetical protein